LALRLHENVRVDIVAAAEQLDFAARTRGRALRSRVAALQRVELLVERALGDIDQFEEFGRDERRGTSR